METTLAAHTTPSPLPPSRDCPSPTDCLSPSILSTLTDVSPRRVKNDGSGPHIEAPKKIRIL